MKIVTITIFLIICFNIFAVLANKRHRRTRACTAECKDLVLNVCSEENRYLYRHRCDECLYNLSDERMETKDKDYEGCKKKCKDKSDLEKKCMNMSEQCSICRYELEEAAERAKEAKSQPQPQPPQKKTGGLTSWW